MAVFKCKMCGGDLNIAETDKVVECEYCGTTQTVPTADNEKKMTLFNRANRLRLNNEFDKAAALYEQLVSEFPEEAEAYWGLCLCNWGIEYVDDPATGEKKPTCHRASFESLVKDENYALAMEYADVIAQRVYRREAQEIDRINDAILSVSRNEKPYDVFICYKETDESGTRTHDSVLAQDIYEALTAKGLKVFFSRITLEDKLGRQYEPYIFAALNSAKVMLAVGTKYEHFHAVWVKNEWSRFLRLAAKDRNKVLIPCFRDMDPYDLPDEFKGLQAQDLGKLGAVQDLVRGVEKLLAKDAPTKQEAPQAVVSNPAAASVQSFLKRAFMFLEDGDWNSANEYCEKVLDIDPENASAYLGKLLSELRVRKQEALKEQAEPFDHNNNYQKAVRFADEKLKTALAGCIEHINTRNENARLDSIYTRAKNAMSAANTESAYKEAAHLFESIDEYQDSAVLAQSCYEKAEIARKDAILSEGKSKMTGEVISNYEAAIKLFESISGWKDADEKIYACQKKIEEIKAKAEADRLEKERQAEIARKEAERIAKRNKRIAIITTPIVCAVIAVIAFIIILNTVIIPNSKYNNAIALMEAGKLDEAYSAFIELGDYKDASEKAGDIRLQKTKDQLKNIKVGIHINFGAYEQDNNTSNGKEDVEWLVLEIKDGKALVISKYALDCKQYNTSYTDVTWETSTLRKWLNNDFLNSAFSADEKAMIPTVTVSADKNPEHSTNPGKATQDQVFLLSIPEAIKYFSSDNARQCKPTDYAVANRVYVNSSNGNCWWWLRSPGGTQRRAALVLEGGDVDELGYFVDYDGADAVRPALWIDLNS